VQSPCQLHLGHPRDLQPGRLTFGVAAAVLPWALSMMGSVESVACHRHGTGAVGSVLVFHKKTVLVEESPTASVPPLGSAGSTGPQGPHQVIQRRIRVLVAGRVVRLVADAFTAAVRPLAAGQFQHLVYRG
jgi:hypothetical protein